jgi:CspA family cold shock protein
MSELDERNGDTTGTVEWFDAERGVGVIRPDGGASPCEVRSDMLQTCGLRSLSAGDRVQFRVRDESGARTATDLAMLRAIQRWEGEGGAIHSP